MNLTNVVYQSWIKHVNDKSQQESILMALLSPFPASELLSAINDGFIDSESAIQAYRTKYGIKNMALTINDFASEESSNCARFDI